MSPISSRNSVPPSAISKRPLRAAIAPVKEPFSWPKSSDSSSSEGMAPQLTATKGRLRRGLRSWMARAATSLPVPDSPRISTVESCAATWRMSALTSRIAVELPVRKRAAAAEKGVRSVGALSSWPEAGPEKHCAADIETPAARFVVLLRGECCASACISDVMRVRLFTSGDSRARARVTAVTIARRSLPRIQRAHGTGAGDLTPVATERHLLYEICDGLAEGAETCLDVAVRCDVRHAAGQA